MSAVAGKAGVKNADKYLDCAGAESIGELADKYTVFGRVTPSQKLELVKALKASGHTVGMTGDGVNDVLALKEADCSIAMQSGSDAARNVSNLVLLDSNFASMPKVVAEGRRSINNVERSASLFLSKTVYSLLLAVMFVVIQLPFLFEPIQMTLINALCIGIPSFLLALQPNKDIYHERAKESHTERRISRPRAFRLPDKLQRSRSRRDSDGHLRGVYPRGSVIYGSSA